MKRVGYNADGLRCGETHHRAKLTDEEVDTILYLREVGLSFAAIAAKWDAGVVISKSTVRDICRGKIRVERPVIFKPVKGK